MRGNKEQLIESFPFSVKRCYVLLMRGIKRFCQISGLLKIMDSNARKKPLIHFFRSLLAIHQLEDMIALDVPWWTYSAIAEIERYIDSLGFAPVVFEYGSGASTLWLAKRAKSVISVEHDTAWFDQLRIKLAGWRNIQLLLRKPDKFLGSEYYQSTRMSQVSFKQYVESIHEFKQEYDLIIIDGRSRSACLNESLAYLKASGILILDNSNRMRYQEILARSDLRVQRYYGWVPGSPFKSETAIIQRQGPSLKNFSLK